MQLQKAVLQEHRSFPGVVVSDEEQSEKRNAKKEENPGERKNEKQRNDE